MYRRGTASHSGAPAGRLPLVPRVSIVLTGWYVTAIDPVRKSLVRFALAFEARTAQCKTGCGRRRGLGVALFLFGGTL